MKQLLTLTILAVIINCKPQPPIILETVDVAKVGITKSDTISELDAKIITTYHTTAITWKIVYGDAHKNGMIVIDEVSTKTDTEQWRIERKRCLLDTYLTNFQNCFIVTGLDKKQYESELSLAQAVIIVSYEKKKYDVSEYVAEIETKAKSFIGRKHGIPLKSKVSREGWQ